MDGDVDASRIWVDGEPFEMRGVVRSGDIFNRNLKTIEL